MPVGRVEGRLTADGEKTLPLRNGGEIEIGLGMAYHSSLNNLLHQSPEYFQALRAIAEDRAEGVTPEQYAELRRCLYLRSNGAINPGLRDVLLSAYQDTPEGPVLLNPFVLENPEQLRELEQVEDEKCQRLLRWVRDGGPDGHAGGRG